MAAGMPGVEGISLNRRKSQALLADGVGPEQLTEEQREAMDTTGLTVVRHGMRVVGVPVGTEHFQRNFLQEAVNGEPAELVRALVPMEDAQASFQILRLSATSRLSHLLRTVPPSITCQAAANCDALVEWALASIIAGDGAAAAGLPTPEEVAHDPTVCQNQTYLGHDALRQAHLPIEEGGLGLTSSSSIKGAAYIGCHALVLGRVVAASARGNLPSLLERLPERPMASALLEELKIVATEAKRSQIEDAVDSSWAALAAEEDPPGRGIGTLLVEAGAGGGRGGGEGGREGRGGRGGRGGGSVGQREQWEDPMATQSDREIELSQTNRGVGGVCVGVVPRVQSKLSRALHAHRGKKLLQDLQTQESAATKRAMVRFRGAREKGAMAFVEYLGFSQEDTMEGPLWRETLGRSPGSHDATETCWWDVSWQWLPAGNHPPPRHILLKDGMELSHPQSGAPPGTGSIPS